ncbi:MAG: dihydroorotase [Firmicutes bacterium]|nr:dihydroorotase [Bacillota bacterium]
MKTVIKGGSIVLLDKTIVSDLLIQDGKIVEMANNIPSEGASVIDATNKFVMAGFVDIHTHLREPGFAHKETIETGTLAAVKGGVTAMACMPNTKPCIDNKVTLDFVLNTIKQKAHNKVYPVASTTKGQECKELTDYGTLKEAGACAVSDDGRPTDNLRILKNALLYAKEVGIPLLSHAEDSQLSDKGDVHEGYYSTLTGLKGIPRASEDCAVAREIALCESLDASIHFCHLSTQGAVRLVKEAKARGAKVTAETCPHYFALDNRCIVDYNTRTKVSPPLRDESDKDAIIQAIKEGVIDVIATDHAPHHHDDKHCEYALAAFGISGIETSFAVSYTHLVKANHISLNRLSQLMSFNPSNLLGIGTPQIQVGASADIVIVDTQKKWTVDPKQFASKGKHTPFEGQELYGVVECTLVDGVIKYQKNNK